MGYHVLRCNECKGRGCLASIECLWVLGCCRGVFRWRGRGKVGHLEGAIGIREAVGLLPRDVVGL